MKKETLSDKKIKTSVRNNIEVVYLSEDVREAIRLIINDLELFEDHTSDLITVRDVINLIIKERFGERLCK